MPSVTTPPTETRTFAHRVRLNLDAVDAVAQVAPGKAHQLTQLVLSFVGLIVLPRETHYLHIAGHERLADLATRGWPTWTIVNDLSRRPGASSDTLADLLWHLRSVITSGRIRTTAGDVPFKDVTVFFDQQVAGGGIDTWSASISAPDLRTFCMKLGELVEREE
jgi:hypothetical protein